MNAAAINTPAAVPTPSPILREHFPLVLALALAAGGEAFTSSAVGLALPRIGAGFAASPDEISWAVTLYIAGYAAALPLSAWLSDVLGQKRHLAYAISGYLLTSLGCMLSPSLVIFLVLRTLQGVAGSAFIARAVFSYTKQFRPPVLFKAFYILIGAFGLRALGLPFGGYLIDHLSWRWLFVVPIVVMGLGALPALACSKEIWPRRRQAQPDFIGLTLLAAGFGALLVMLARGQRDGWLGSPVIVTLLLIVLVAVPLFFWQQNRSANTRSFITVSSLRFRGMGVGVTLSFLAGLMMIGGIFVLPQFLLRVIGCDTYHAGWVLAVDAFAMTAGLAVAVWVFGRVLTRLLLTASGLLFSTAMLLLAFRVTAATPVSALYLPMVLHGLGVGLALPPIGIFSFSIIGANHAQNAEGRAWHYTARQIGGAVAIALVVLLLDVRSTLHSSQLAENLTAVNPLVQQTLTAIGRGLASHGLNPAFSRQGAGLVLSHLVARESVLFAFRDLFFVSSAVGLLVSGLSFGLPRVIRRAPRPAPTATVSLSS